MTRFCDHLGFPPKEVFFSTFDVMVVKAQLDWQGPAGFDDEIEIAVVPIRLGTKSFDLEYRATVEGRPVCTRRRHLCLGQARRRRIGRDPAGRPYRLRRGKGVAERYHGEKEEQVPPPVRG